LNSQIGHFKSNNGEQGITNKAGEEELFKRFYDGRRGSNRSNYVYRRNTASAWRLAQTASATISIVADV